MVHPVESAVEIKKEEEQAGKGDNNTEPCSKVEGAGKFGRKVSGDLKSAFQAPLAPSPHFEGNKQNPCKETDRNSKGQIGKQYLCFGKM